MIAEALAHVLRPLHGNFPPIDYSDLLVELDSLGDAAVWRLDDKRSLMVSIDFYISIVDDPYNYGATAAANSLSDIYAICGLPFLALEVGSHASTDVSGYSLLGVAGRWRQFSKSVYVLFIIKSQPSNACMHRYAQMSVFSDGATNNQNSSHNMSALLLKSVNLNKCYFLIHTPMANCFSLSRRINCHY